MDVTSAHRCEGAQPFPGFGKGGDSVLYAGKMKTLPRAWWVCGPMSEHVHLPMSEPKITAGKIRQLGRLARWGGGGPELSRPGRAGIASSNRRVHDDGRRAAAPLDRGF
jgi:hypothetical protein